MRSKLLFFGLVQYLKSENPIRTYLALQSSREGLQLIDQFVHSWAGVGQTSKGHLFLTQELLLKLYILNAPRDKFYKTLNVLATPQRPWHYLPLDADVSSTLDPIMVVTDGSKIRECTG